MPEQPQNPDSADPASWSRREIKNAIAGLDRATREFSREVNAIQGLAPERRTTFDPQVPARAEAVAPPAAPPSPRRPDPRPAGGEPAARIDPETAFEEQMRVAEREARAYLERAKRRADSLVNTMIGAVEHEAVEIRRDAENAIRERWGAVEAEAGQFLDDAKRVADGMVIERQQQIGSLSDGIVDRAHSLTAGLADAERVRAQFDDFVRALSETANQIAQQPSGRVEAEITRLQERSAGARRNAAAA